MQGKFRKRSMFVYCPKKSKDYVIENDLESILSGGMPIGEITRKGKTGMINMENCNGCDFFEEYAIDMTGVFCTYPVKAKREPLKNNSL